MDDELAKAMKVIRLKTKNGRYLTAGDDQVSVTLTKPKNVENTEWTLEWVKGLNKDLEGQVRLWSRYNKALNFPHDPADYYNKDEWGDALTQQPWPLSASAVWKFKLKKRENYDVPDQVGYLFKWSKQRGNDFMFNYDHNFETKFKFYLYSSFKRFRLERSYWIVEVVQPQPRPQGCANKVTTCIRLPSPPKNEDKSHDESLIGSNSKNNVGYSSPDQLMSTFSRCQVGQFVLYVSPTSTRDCTGVGQRINSGGNVNGSGVQNNGDVSLYSEINRSRDNTFNLGNYNY